MGHGGGDGAAGAAAAKEYAAGPKALEEPNVRGNPP